MKVDKVIGFVRLIFFFAAGWAMIVAIGCLIRSFIAMASGASGTTFLMMGIVSILTGAICVLFCVVLGDI